jgi:hypothetical protein
MKYKRNRAENKRKSWRERDREKELEKETRRKIERKRQKGMKEIFFWSTFVSNVVVVPHTFTLLNRDQTSDGVLQKFLVT